MTAEDAVSWARTRIFTFQQKASELQRKQAEMDEGNLLDFCTLLSMALIRGLENQTPGK